MSDASRRILVAEDDRAIANIIRFNLERAGFIVNTADNGSMATDLLKVHTFDLVITDYQMPEMNGELLCRLLREDKRHAGVPILMCTAKAFELDSCQLKAELRISEILYKPFSPREMVKLVRANLRNCPLIAPSA